MKKFISDIIIRNTRLLSPRVRLWGMLSLALLTLYGGIFYTMKTFGANRAYAFSRPSLIEMDAAAKQHYAADLKKMLIKEPEKIHMLLEQDIQLVFARPDLERHDAMIAMKQYRSASCVLDIYFKPAEKKKFAPVMHYELRKRQKAFFSGNDNVETVKDARACVDSLLHTAEKPAGDQNSLPQNNIRPDNI